MTEDPTPTAPDGAPRSRERLGRPPRFLVIIAGLVLLAVAGWSAVWYVGTRKADDLLAAWLDSEAAKGRTYRCGERSVGGYPFRVTATCASPQLDIADSGPRLRLAAEGFRAVAQVWNLTHVIFEIDGPVRIGVGGDDTGPDALLDADWQVLQGSVRAPGGQIRRIDVVARDIAATPEAPAYPGGPAMRLSARELQLHGRRADAADGSNDIEAALTLDGLVTARAGAAPSQPVDIAFVGRLDALPYPAPREPAAFLAAWRDNGGSIDVARLSAQQGGAELRAAGRIAPDAAGRPEGRVTVSLAGAGSVDSGTFGGLGPIVGMALQFVGKPTEIDGRPAITGEIDFRDGRMLIGGVAIAELPPLF
jgi:hypothetical protein